MANQNRAISSFAVIRKLVRNLYLEGFNNYLETGNLGKSSRAFTNNLNSIRNFLNDRFMSSKTNTKKQSNPVISFDTREETENPLFALWKTSNSIASNLSFDFAIMDILEDYPDGINWFSLTSDSYSTKHVDLLGKYVSKGIDKKGVKVKLEKLAEAGIIEFSEDKKKIRKTDTKKLKQLLSSKEVKQAIQFASETCPLGVIGSFILDSLSNVNSEPVNTPIHYKHHYVFNSIDYEIMYILLEAINEKCFVEIESERFGLRTIVPLKIFISTQTGRAYVVFWNKNEDMLFSENLELILAAKKSEICSEYELYEKKLSEMECHMWGVSFKMEKTAELEHVRFVIEYPTEQEKRYIPARIKREAVTGTIKELDDYHSEFTADIIDSNEIVPWINSFFGRITELDFPYASRIKEDVSLLAEGKYREEEQGSRKTTNSYEQKSEINNTPLFSPLYSTYYFAIRNILETYIRSKKQPLSNETIAKLIEASAYIEAPGELADLIFNRSETTTIFRESKDGVSSPINHIPDFPLTTIELRFIAAILQDKRIKMFMTSEVIAELQEALKDVKPLWETDDIKYFDQNKDGDNFDNKTYVIQFQTILNAINYKKFVYMIYGRKNTSDVFTPTHLDYSQKDNAFRVFVKELKYPINLENIKSVEITEEKPVKDEDSTVYETLKVEIYDDTSRQYHFNRAIRTFSYFKKSCKKSEKENTYELSVDYDKSDESEIVIKILMFGPNMKVLEPQSVIDEINYRVTRQKHLFEKS